mmetsp:Transcript_108221/g.132040  ORF Transcript_108221/g.132040 Transcript_108221/m.132040 type:complete len:202 (-) Transcript_108221:80-685(-)
MTQKHFFIWDGINESQFMELKDIELQQQRQIMLDKLNLNKIFTNQDEINIVLDICVKILMDELFQKLPNVKHWMLIQIFVCFIQKLSESSVNMTPMEGFDIFKDILLKHSIQRPPFSIAVFAVTDLKPITDWFVQHVFKHFKAYQLSFSKPSNINQNTDINQNDNKTNESILASNIDDPKTTKIIENNPENVSKTDTIKAE